MLNVDLARTKKFVSEEDLVAIEKKLADAHDLILNGTGEGADFLGWVNLPETFDRDEYARVQAAGEKIRKNSDVLLVIGIGGSYLGARAAIEFIKGSMYNQSNGKDLEVYFAGNNISADYYNEIVSIIGDRDFSINVISKSGSTTEPAIAFRFFKNMIEEKYGKAEAKSRIYVTTDKYRGALKALADNEGYETFIIPDNIGGRYSVLTSVGLLPMAAVGIDTDAVIAGALCAMKDIKYKKDYTNPAWLYAAARNIMYQKGKKVEILACFDPRLRNLAEWWKQLFGESEGKGNIGIFPASVEFAADLHSLGQYIQEGERFLQETIVSIKETKTDIVVLDNPENFDGLNYLSGKTLNFINKNACVGAAMAHADGGVPNMSIELRATDEETFGYLVYFFEFSCALSGYVLGVNPFDQPGVEAYKNNIFRLLGKPGYENV